MNKIEIHKLSAEKGIILGFALVAHPDIVADEPARVSDGKDELEVPLRWYGGDLNMIRTELHKTLDEAIDALVDE